MTKQLHQYAMALVIITLCCVGLTQAQAPTITLFTPTSGAGGTRVTITGTNFTGATSLTIGGQPVHSYWVSSATTIVAVVGTGATGAIEVRSTTGVGNSSVPMTNNFTVTGPGVFAEAPNTAVRVLGQANFTGMNQALTQTGMREPYSVAIDPTTGKVFVSDQNYHRVLRFASWGALTNGAAAEGVLGQPNFTSGSPNQGGSISATTLNQPAGVSVDGGGRLWVVDQFNHRILRYDNAAAKSNGGAADGVLGQANFTSGSANPGGRSATTASLPYGVYVDGGGRLWVADQGNHRILRYDNAAAKSNGAAADGVLGQANFTSGLSNQGNIANCSATTASFPTAVSVDGGGRLWVTDQNNHRILRYDNAAAKSNGAAADGVLGQANFTSGLSNQGGSISATTASFPYGVSVDGGGRLWVADQFNNRILRYDNAAAKSNGGAADGVLGQANFTSGSANPGGISATTASFPVGVSVDGGGRLWVADQFNNRVLVYEGVPPTQNPTITSFTPTSGAGGTQVTITGTNFTGATSLTIGGQPVHSYWVSSATTIVAVVGTGATGAVEVRTTIGTGTSGTNFTVTGPGVFGNPIPTVATLVLGQTDFVSATSGVANMSTPFSIAVDPTTGKVFVADAVNNRILRFASYSSLVNGSAPEGVLGQANFTNNSANPGGVSASTVSFPTGISVDGGGRLWVADYNNHRILRYDNASSKPNGAAADGVLGQGNFTLNTANLGGLSATSINFPNSVFVDGGGRLWSTEGGNHRILRYDNAASKANGAAADGVLGQPDFTAGSANQGSSASATTINVPGGVFVDGGGRLWVADKQNSRVLRYDNAANKANGAAADGVLGRTDFTTLIFGGISAATLSDPIGVFVDGGGRLWVSDRQNSRILRYDNASSKLNGAAADGVIGQHNFISNFPNQGSVCSANTLALPLGIFVDNAGRLWTTDQINNRVLVYEYVPPPSISSVVPGVVQATTAALNITLSGTNMGNVASLAIGRLNSGGTQVGTVNILPFAGPMSATSITIALPAGTVATGGTLTISLSNALGTTTAELLVQSDNIIVTNANNDGGGSLRRAFALTSTGGTIQIQGSIPPVTLTGGPIEVNKDIRLIDNNGGLEINGNGNPVFDVQCGGNLYLENVILTGSGNNPAIRNDCGTVILRRSRATGN